MSDAEDWKILCALAEVPPGLSHVAWLDDLPVLVVNLDGTVYALEDRCSHEDYELSSGAVDAAAGSIECVLHGAKFDVRTGEALCAPAYEPVRSFPVKVEEDLVWIKAPTS